METTNSTYSTVAPTTADMVSIYGMEVLTASSKTCHACNPTSRVEEEKSLEQIKTCKDPTISSGLKLKHQSLYGLIRFPIDYFNHTSVVS